MIKIYSPQEVNMEKVDKRDTSVFWDYPIEEMEDLIDNNDEAMYVLWQGRLIEIIEDFLDDDDWDTWECEPTRDDWDDESNWYQQDMIDLHGYEQ